MFWKKSKDKDNSSKNSSKTVYHSDCGVTTAGSAITSFESKYKSSANSSSSKTKITITSTATQKMSQKQEFSSLSQVSRSLRECQLKLKELDSKASSISANNLMDSSNKWKNAGSQSKQTTILSRQKTEPSIVRRIDATPFNSKYESPYRNANLPPVRTPVLPASRVTTVTTTYQSPYRATSTTSLTSSSKVQKTTYPIRNINSASSSTSSGLFSSSPKTSSTIWNPLSSIENARPTSNPTWNNASTAQLKLLNPQSTSVLTSPKSTYSSSVFPVILGTSNSAQASSSLVKPSSSSPLPMRTTSAQPVVSKKKLAPGVVHIFHNDKFDSPDKEFRIGSIEDVRLLKKTFQGFKMQVNLYENCTVKQVEDKIRKIELKDYTTASCIVIVILTHGTRYETVAAKDGSYSIDDTILFPILRNRSLRSKPKLLFIQACKGSMEPGKFHKDAIQPNGPPDEILKCYSTFEGYVSYRSEKGSIFIKSLCELLQEHGKSMNIKDIMDLVIRHVKINYGSMQIPSYETTLTEPYVFGDFM